MTCALGIDVGGTTTKVCLCDESGTRLASTTVPTPRQVDALADVVAEQVSWGREHGPALDAVGVVVPGIVDETSGTAVLSVNLGWRHVPLRDLLAAAAGVPVVFGHDVRAGALAEARWGAGARDMLYVPIGTGIAAAVVLDGRPVVSGGYAGELGQALVTDPATGRAVTMETVASAAAIARRYAERSGDVAADGGAHRGHAASGGARLVLERAAAGDVLAKEVFDRAIAALAGVLAISVTALGPLRIVLGGGLAEAGELLSTAVRDAVADRLVITPPPEVVTARLGPWSQALGAAAMALDARLDGSAAP